MRNALEGRVVTARVETRTRPRARAALLATLCLVAASCKSDPEANADTAAENAAKAYVFDSKTDEALGLKNSSVFGREHLGFLPQFGFPNGGPSVERAPDGARLVTASFWCDGYGPDGSYGKYERTIRVRMVKADPKNPASFAPEKVDILSSSDLSGARQFFTWLLWSSIAPICVWLWVTFYCGAGNYVVGSQLGTLAARYTSTPFAAYLSYVFFGSWVAVALFAAVHFALVLLFLRCLTGLIRAITQPQHTYY